MADDSIFELARKQIYWMIAGVLITITVIALVFLFSSYQKQLVAIPEELRAELISLRFVNTPECFTYQDPVTGKIFPGVIEINKFTQERLDACYKTEPEKGFKDFNFALELEGYTSIVDGEKKLLRTNNYFNKVDFTMFKEVYVRTGDTLEPTRMIIYVQARI